MPTLIRWQATIVDNAGNVLNGASVRIDLAGTATKAGLFDDDAGLIPRANPLTANADGYAFAYIAAGRYDITATLGGDTIVWLGVELAGYQADQQSYDNSVSGLTATDTKAALDELAASGGGSTNLSIGTTTATTLDINSSSGTNATIPGAVASSAAGLLTGADKAKLDGIESGATADQTGAEIKTAYEGEPDTNAYTDAEKAIVGGTETVYTSDGTAVAQTNGTWQKHTLAANKTPTFTIGAGQSVFVTFVPGAFTLTLSGVTEWVGGAAPATIEAEHAFVFWSDDGVAVTGQSIGGIS